MVVLITLTPDTFAASGLEPTANMFLPKVVLFQMNHTTTIAATAHKMIVENSGLLTVAALKHLDVKGKKIVSILSGGNMDVITMSSVIQNGLIQRDRIFTVSVLLPDKPGELVRVSQVIANENGNVIKLDHNQFFTTNRSAAVELRITMEAFGTDHKNRIVKALEEAGYTPKIVRPNL